MRLPWQRGSRYAKLQHADEEAKNIEGTVNGVTDFSPTAAARSKHGITTSIMVYSLLALMLLTVVGIASVINAFSLHRDISASSPQRPCGNSSAEAISLGCSWDQLTWSWLPPNCPHYANDEFLEAGDWRYYTDFRGEHEAVGDVWTQALDNQFGLYTHRAEHFTHCVYLFVSMSQVIRDGGRHHARLTGWEHARHCAEMVLEALRRDVNWTMIDTFSGTVSYDETC